MNSSQKSPPQVTLRDIAHSLGVTAATVSMALHNHPKISALRRKQIHQAAVQMGYHPNAMAVALAQKRYDSTVHPIGSEIAWINCWKDPQKLRSFKEFDLNWLGAEQAAENLGFRLVEFVVGAPLSFSRLEKILQSRAIQGILVPPHGGGAEASPGVSSLDWRKYSIVRLGCTVPLPVHMVAANYIQGPKLAFSRILKLGYRRVGFSSFLWNRSQASLLMCQTDLPQSQRLPILVLSPNQTMDSKRNHLDDWMKKNKPDAILTDLAEMPLMLQELGYRVPKDIGLAATSVLDGNIDAGLYQNSEEVGSVAVKLLVNLLHHHEMGIPEHCQEVLVDVSWQEGSTLPRRSAMQESRAEIQ